MTDSFVDNMNFLNARRSRKGRISNATQAPAAAGSAAIAKAGANPGYVAAAVRRELERLAAAAEGTRNHTLNQVAFALFGFIKSGHANGQALRLELERLGLSIGLPSSEVDATLRSAWAAAEPRRVPAPRGVA